ncbi:putative two-component system sensor kinase [Euzebya pacifica]|uniref:Putative two-component system sensor kinase n=1 Tax=Euzebya pacifica TaxID=1608957 RepID=A0A346XYC6_9ACTN|nr:putative two-component system sensor kinase [Euzebya pacifica]
MVPISTPTPTTTPDPGPVPPPPAASSPDGPAPSSSTLSAVTAPLTDLGITRSTEDRVVSGVAAGVANRIGVDVGVVRLVLVVLATAGGAGVLLYALGHVLLPEPSVDPESAETAPVRTGTVRHAVALGLITAGVLVLLRALGVWFADSLTWSVGLAAIGSAVVWTRASEEEKVRWRHAMDRAVGDRVMPDLASLSRIRLSVGAILLLAGMATFLVTIDLSAAPEVILASLVTIIGVALVIGPWFQALGRQLADERRERIRSEERADMAAHLHDSVLQTLALIQRSGSPEEMSRLARGQERELRAWLFGRRPDDAATRLGQAIQDAAGLVEDRYGVKVEVVLAGDVALDEHLHAMVEAAREAMANAAKHAEVDRVDVFVEVEPDRVEVFVRDEGVGFDPTAVPEDRRGLVESIRGRMQRHGGTATIESVLGEGTEVELHLPLDPSPPVASDAVADAADDDPDPDLDRPL